MSLFGECTYFNLIKMPNKEIPADIVDKGCKHWAKEKQADIIKQIIMTFDGVMIE